VFIASEGDTAAEPAINPFVNEYSLVGELLQELPVPDKFLPDPENEQGIRNNLAFESLTLSPDESVLYVATENTLAQDNEELENRSTNFKFVPWENVAKAFPEPLLSDPTGYNPRD
jgi:hypothetical protein